MKCPRCQNEDPMYFGVIQGRVYCRKCIQFGRVFVDEKIEYPEISVLSGVVSYKLKFKLTDQQLEISNSLVDRYLKGLNSTVLAVCGGGKTEILYEVIKTALNRHDSVLILIPRKSLVIELAQRISNQFNFSPEMLYGGHIGDLSSPFIISTVHQSYRLLPRDLVIVDEVDAFPLYGDSLLEEMVKRVTKKQSIMMSATMTRKSDDLFLNRRYHGYDLDIPTVLIMPQWLQKIVLRLYLGYFKKANQPVLIFVPTKEMLHSLHLFPLNESRYVRLSSESRDIDKELDKLRNHDLDGIITTIVLERGITVENVQVIVMQANHSVFTSSCLIQISGRVGRSINHPCGKVVFLSQSYNRSIKECLKKIKSFNQKDV